MNMSDRALTTACAIAVISDVSLYTSATRSYIQQRVSSPCNHKAIILGMSNEKEGGQCV